MSRISELLNRRSRHEYTDANGGNAPIGPERGLQLTKKFGAFALAAVVGLMGYASSKHTTGDTEIGVKLNKWTGSVEVVTAGSTKFFPPIVNDWYVLDAKLMSYAMVGINQNEYHGDSLKFKTPDGNDIALEATAQYHIDPQNAEAVIRNVGRSNEEILEKIVKPYSRSIPRDYFGSLTSSEFADANSRNEVTGRASDALAEKLAEYGIIGKPIQVRDFIFVTDAYRTAVQDKKIADGALPAVLSGIEKQAEVNQRMLNEGEQYKQKTMATADGMLAQAKVEADGYFEQQQSLAKGILAEGRNMAEAIRKERESMNSRGGKTLVQMEIANQLQKTPIQVLPICDGKGNLQIQSFDLNQYLQTRGLQSVAKPSGN